MNATPMDEFTPGQRVWVEDENSAGTVVSDYGFERYTRRTADCGLTVTIDRDGVDVECSHDQVTDLAEFDGRR